MDITYMPAQLRDLLVLWGPRVLAAIVILVVAMVAGRALKWAIAKGVDRIPALAQHNQGLEPRKTAGANFGEIAYWLVLLIGVVAALNALQLGQVAAPLNTLLNNVMAYLPNVVGAGLIFFVGFVIATLAKRLVTAALAAVNIDGLMARAGLSRATGTTAASGTFASAIGALVMVLILIPVSIAALQALRIEAISRPAITVLTTILDAIPNVLAAGIVLAIGYFIGRWIAGVVERVLPATGFDRALGGIGELTSFRSKASGDGQRAPGAAATAPAVTPSKIVASIVLFAIVAFAGVEASRLLNFAAIAVILSSVLTLAGKILIGGAIIAFGVVIADMLANLMGRSTGQPRSFAISIVRWSAVALAVAMGLKFMGIADQIVILAFGLILGSAAVATAIAFGLGGRDAAGRLAEDWVNRIQSGFGPAPRSQAGGAQVLNAPREQKSFESKERRPPPAT